MANPSEVWARKEEQRRSSRTVSPNFITQDYKRQNGDYDLVNRNPFLAAPWKTWGRKLGLNQLSPGTIFSGPHYTIPENEPTEPNSHYLVAAWGLIHHKVRKFVIISAHATGFVALPIYTFQGKGISARERDQNEYCELVESCSEPPPPNLGVHMQLYMELHPSMRSSGNDLRDKGDEGPNRSRYEYTLTSKQPVFYQFSCNYIIEGRLLRFSPYVQERPQDQISWVRQMTANGIEPMSGVTLEVREDGVQLYRREAVELLDGKHFYDTSGSTIKYFLSSQVSTNDFVPIPIGEGRTTRLYRKSNTNELYYYQPCYGEESESDFLSRLQRVQDDNIDNIPTTPPRSVGGIWRYGALGTRGRGKGDDKWRRT